MLINDPSYLLSNNSTSTSELEIMVNEELPVCSARDLPSRYEAFSEEDVYPHPIETGCHMLVRRPAH